ncbi:LysR family transcriptional regulator [Pelagibacterium xiamenense]|uniref:LysR family transcriptional regulator n=1 Tax=Pelagibacterium xiamenense TaxID=2901140 RepID=UPI001E4AA2A4|nr:LysR substrate-binding domain-containing protein [Pelagibacterium xiamenense]MCD7059745.1 LysR substrate-binding domain-containing protein [Pelagibacterium xiamenense]
MTQHEFDPRDFDIEDVCTFGLIAAAGGLSAAARRFGRSKASLSRALTRLETAAGSPLFDRMARGLRLTPLGETLRPAAEAAIEASRQADEVLRRGQSEPSGPLRIAASALLGEHILAPVLAGITRRYPKVRTELHISGLGPDPLAENLDVVLRLGRPDEPHLVAKRVLASPLALFVPAAAAIDPHDTDAIAARGRLVVAVAGVSPNWELTDGRDTLVLDSPPRLVVEDPAVAVSVLKAGEGIAFLPRLYGEHLVSAQTLARVLPDWTGPLVEVYAVMPPRRATVPAVRVFLDTLDGHIRRLMASIGR